MGVGDPKRCILVGVSTHEVRPAQMRLHLEELVRLAETAGCTIAAKVTQNLNTLRPATVLGKGKLAEIMELCLSLNAGLVIFDEDLTASQARNIEKILEDVKILDRSGLILDIFACHARTSESRTMVEIAQLEYLLPRLTRAWTHLSRQVAGVGMRGPGETQLETDRRLVRRRITDLKKKLLSIEKARKSQAVRRNSTFHVGVVGYTNAGKSTLANRMTNADVLVQDQLFATLDSTTRKLYLSPGKEAILSDTVGFIRKLPHHLVASFQSTLGVVTQSDLVIHVVDSLASDYRDHMEVTSEVLSKLLDENTPRLLVFNKVDALEAQDLDHFRQNYPESMLVSARENLGIEGLRQRIETFHDNWRRRL